MWKACSCGVGESLSAALAEEAVKRNVWRLQVAVLDWSVSAIKFYDRLGAKEDDWPHCGMDESELRKLAGGPS
jgi:hypothetical protein